MKNLSTGLFFLSCVSKSPELMRMLKDIAEFVSTMNKLSAITGLPIPDCADIVRNTAKESGEPWKKVAAMLKNEAMKGGKIYE